MKLKIDTTEMSIVPESTQDEIYLESLFDLKHEGDTIEGSRHNTYKLSCWSGIVFEKQRKKVNKSDTTCMPPDCITETV